MSRIDTVIVRLAERQHGVVAARQLLGRRLSRAAIKMRAADGRLRRLHRGVYAVGHDRLTSEGRWLAAVLACGAMAVLSHRSAAALWDMRQTSRTAVDVIVPGARRRSRSGITIHGHRVIGADVTVVRGIPVTSPARTVLDLAEVIDPRGVERTYERAGKLRLLDAAQAQALLERSNGHRGAGLFAKLLERDLAAPAEALSELELMFCELVREAGLPAPQVNVLVEGYLVDAYWPEAGLVVELQGHAYHSDRASFERDNEKHVRLRLAGFELLPFTYRKVADEPEWVLAAVAAALGKGRPPRGSPRGRPPGGS